MFSDALNVIPTNPDADAYLKLLTEYRIFKQTGKISRALCAFEQLDSITVRKFHTHIDQNLTGTIVDYLNLSQRTTKAELQAIRMRNWIVIIISTFLIVIVVGLSLLYRVQQRKKLDDRILFAERLQNMLIQIQAENTKASSIIRELLASKYELLEELCNIIISCSNPRSARQRIAESVTTLIDNLSIRSDKIIAMEHQVDTMYDNLFSDFRKDLPSLKDADYRLYLFTIFGLSNTAISIFLKEDKLTAIYDRKRRLKDRIRQLDPTKCARYMAFFR